MYLYICRYTCLSIYFICACMYTLTRRFWNHSQTLARASQPDNLTFSSPKLGEAYPSDTAIAEANVGHRREPPSQTILPFKSHARRGLPVRHGNCWSHRRTSARASQPDKLILSVCSHYDIEPRRMPRAQPFRQSLLSVHYRRGSTIRLTSIDLTSDAARASRLDNLTFSSYVSEANPSNRRARPPVGWRLSIPTKTLAFRLHLSDTVSLDLPSVAGESTPGQTTLPFLVPRWRRLPVQHSGYCAPVGRRREPHSETTYRFSLGRRD